MIVLRKRLLVSSSSESCHASLYMYQGIFPHRPHKYAGIVVMVVTALRYARAMQATPSFDLRAGTRVVYCNHDAAILIIHAHTRVEKVPNIVRLIIRGEYAHYF